MQASFHRGLVAFALTVSILGAPRVGLASPHTLQRSVENILFAPADLLLSPVVAGRVIHENLQNTDDSLAVKVIFLVPGFLWNTAVQAGAAILREVTGLIEVVPGVVLLPLEADLPLLFAPAEHGAALVDVDTPALRVKFGVDYLTPPR
jgi:hypothetical protein